MEDIRSLEWDAVSKLIMWVLVWPPTTVDGRRARRG
jgi:hypothetical protein